MDGNGGKGGNANSTESDTVAEKCNKNTEDNPEINTNSGFDGENGESCGIVKINNDVKVYAYGGAGGAGENGIGARSWRSEVGYPAAGIGRWTVLGRRWCRSL